MTDIIRQIKLTSNYLKGRKGVIFFADDQVEAVQHLLPDYDHLVHMFFSLYLSPYLTLKYAMPFVHTHITIEHWVAREKKPHTHTQQKRRKEDIEWEQDDKKNLNNNSISLPI